MSKKNNSNLQLILEYLAKKLNLLSQSKVMSLSPTDNDITSISHMLDERQNIIDEVSEIDEQIDTLINELSLSEKNTIKNILIQQDIPQDLPIEMIDIDNVVKKIYNELSDILTCNQELDEKLSFIKDNLVMQIKQINSNNQIFKYSSGTIGGAIGSVMDTKH